MHYIVKILSITHVTHNVLRIIIEKPERFQFTPGQATDVTINRTGWKEEKRPFTFTSIPNNDFLEFTIKTYPERKGVTDQLLGLQRGDELILHDVFGDISYKGEGVFMAGGAGITPFISIFRQLRELETIGKNKLIFGNKTRADIIHEEEFNNLLGENFINVLSEEEVKGYEHGFINEYIINSYVPADNKYFYICGPPAMIDALEKLLAEMEIAEQFIIKESF